MVCEYVCVSRGKVSEGANTKILCGHGYTTKRGFTSVIKGNAKFDTNNTYTPAMANGIELMDFVFVLKDIITV